MYAIKADKLTKFYGKSRGIYELDLEVGRGEFFGFIGPNGAGKSTTVRTLLGLIAPTGGRAEVLGYDICRDRQNILRSVGYLPSEASFYSGMRVRDVLKLSADLRKMDCSAEAEALSERLKLDTGRRIDELSLGNKKKVSIVCALQHDPELLILDEPTGGLDPLMQKEFFDILKQRNERGTTVFLSSHILSEISKYCNRAAIIRDGSIIACDSVTALAKTNAKRVSLKGHADLDALTGVRDLKVSEDGVSFLYGAEMRELLLTLSASDVTDITITEPELDEIFLHYYKKGAEGL